MSERLLFWAGYIGSAALVAFLATCLGSPRVATYTCDTAPGSSEQRCVLSETYAAAPAQDAPRDAARVAVALDAVN